MASSLVPSESSRLDAGDWTSRRELRILAIQFFEQEGTEDTEKDE